MDEESESDQPTHEADTSAKAGAPSRHDRAARTAAQVGPAPEYDPIRITSHRGLIGKQREIFQRFNDNPEIATLLFLNPVLAFKEIGVELTPELRRHVLHAVQHPPGPRARREELEASLRETLGEAPKPLDRKWLAGALFDTLALTPLKTGGHKPVYRPPYNEKSVERMKALRPKMRRARHVPRSKRGNVIRVKPWRSSFRRMDLEAPVPELSPAKKAPTTVSLETLFFYKDASPVARDLLELGVLQKRAFPVQSSASFRKIRSGEKANAFRSWIKSVRFNLERGGGDL